jgi:SpoVK/Ycf46/Vps4 family AAA+-type ATPase
MINKIADRCDILPWELCCLFVDEIDGIAPNRMRSNVNDHFLNMMSVFLSIMDGAKKKPNLFILGTSNRLSEMDQAFKERFDLKMFLGLPNFDARKKWFKKMVENYKKTIDTK